MPNIVPIKTINKLAIPAMLAGIVEPLIGLVDTAIIGNSPIESTESIAAIGLATTFYFFVFWVFVQLETALSSIVSKFLGQKKVNELNPLITQSLILNLLLGLFLYFTTNLFIDQVLEWYHATGRVAELAKTYFKIRSIGFPISLLTYSLWGVFRGYQNTVWAMVIGAIGGVINLILDYILIFGIEGWIEPMGVRGAAIGSVSAQTVILILSIVILYRKTPFRLVWQSTLHPEFKNLMTTSGNFILRTIALNLVLFEANSMATQLGTNQIAAHTIAMQLWLFSSFILDGYANAGLALSGKLLAENKLKSLQYLIKKLLQIGVAASVVVMIVYGIGYNYWGNLFSNDPQVISIFKKTFLFIIIAQPINALAFTYDGILKGIAASTFIRDMMVLAWLFFLPLAYFIESIFHLGLNSLWIAMIGWMIWRSVVPYLFMKKSYFRSLH